MKHLILAATALLGISSAYAGPLPVYRYTVTGVTATNLGTLGGSRSEAYDINNQGIVVGWSDDAIGVAQAFYYMDGTMTPLDPSIGPHTNVATGINNRNQVSGTVEHLRGAHAFVGEVGWPIVALFDLDGSGARVESSAAAISDSELVVGQRNHVDPPEHFKGTVWNWSDLYSFDSHDGYETVFNDVNSAGEIVGHDIKWGTMHVWRWASGETTWELIPLPDYAGDCTYFEGDALGINNGGTIVGYVECDINKHAMLWNRHFTASTDLGVLPTGTHSIAEGINDAEFVAGYADRLVVGFGGVGMSLDSAFLFHREFGMYALPTPKFAVWYGHCRAKALNERNAKTGLIQVVGTCDTSSGTSAVRWDVTVEQRLFP